MTKFYANGISKSIYVQTELHVNITDNQVEIKQGY